jgi:tRNA pseudouridine55 synthase
MSQSQVGVLNIDKPQGYTSHDVVARIRKLTGIRRVGHAGTLDPMATGVLLVCVGPATRISDYLQQGRKMYRTTFRLGQSTDTYDADGKVLTTAPVPELSLSDLDRALTPFHGEIQQIPPMYSAIKLKGQPLHKLARAGIQVERKARSITIFDISIEAWQTPDITVLISCSPGTYVRSIAFDLGEALGCGGHVQSLRRVSSGTWRVEDATTLENLLAAQDDWPNYLHGLRSALSMLPPVVLTAEQAYRFALGQSISAQAEGNTPEVRVLGPDEQIIGIGRVNTERMTISPYKVFVDSATLAPIDISPTQDLD